MKSYGLDVSIDFDDINLRFYNNTIGPDVEIRTLESIRSSLRNPNCSGPENVYAIAMDVYKEKDVDILLSHNLLFGVVTYSKGSLGDEPIRSQGHIHAKSKSCNASTPELYEIWTGTAAIYMQEKGGDDPGKCYAVIAEPGDKVLVPPGWVHATVSIDPNQQLTFGAWCVRDYGFEYEAVRAHKGIAHFPKISNGQVIWEANSNYIKTDLIIKKPRVYEELNITADPIYTQFEENNDKFLFISNPHQFEWEGFVP